MTPARVKQIIKRVVRMNSHITFLMSDETYLSKRSRKYIRKIDKLFSRLIEEELPRWREILEREKHYE